MHAFTRGGPPGRTPDRKLHEAAGAAAASPPGPPRIVSGKALDDAPLAPQHPEEGVNDYHTMIGFAASPAPPVVSRRLAGACCLALLSGALACRAETQKRETGAPAPDVPVAAIPAVPAPDSGRDATPVTADEDRKSVV